MEKFDPRVDAYIGKAAPFAQPVLKYLRDLVHLAAPEVTETIKWGFPNFDYKGPLCSMASFKQHCAFGFWKKALLEDPDQIFHSDDTAGNLGKLTSLSDLPSEDILIKYIRSAVKLNDDGVKVSKKPAAPRTELVVPSYFAEVLSRHPAAAEAFQNFSYSHKKEYLEWITEAKTEATRDKRMQTAIEWLTDGKSRHWKYKESQDKP